MKPALRVPQASPKAAYLAHKEEIDGAVSRVLSSGRYILGEETIAFECEFAAYLGVRFAVGVGNGTDALEIALRALGIGIGDEVITVSHTAVATIAAIQLAGAMPVFVDIDPLTYTMDPAQLLQAIRPNTRAVVPVHLYGHPADMSSIMTIARGYGLAVVEDCAQSHGASTKGVKTGAWGDIGIFSFYPTKNLGALGDGGIVVTNNPDLAEQARLIREYGWQERYISSIAGMNSRLDELQAAILRVKLQHLDEDNLRRNEWAQHYRQMLAETSIRLPTCSSSIEHCFHLYVVATERREELQDHLNREGIGTSVHYPLAVHQQPAYRHLHKSGLPLTQTEKLVPQLLSLPLYPEMTLEQVQSVAQAIISWDRGPQPLFDLKEAREKRRTALRE